jgi:hypothetical protein
MQGVTTAFLLLLAIQADVEPQARVHGTIEATIEGTDQPLEAVLLVRDGESWKEVDRRALAGATRVARFDRLASGVYQILVSGPGSTEQLATKVMIGTGDTRRTVIAIEPITVIGRVTLGGGELGSGVISLRHKEFRWQASVKISPDGTFRIPLWQRGTYACSVRAAAITVSYAGMVEIQGASPIHLPIDVPDGRITGVVRDAKSGEPVADAYVGLQTDSPEGVQYAKVTTDSAGRFDFVGMKFSRHTLRVISERHLDPSPVVVDLQSTKKGRELDIRLESGRAMTIVVTNADGHPIANAAVFAATDGRHRSRGTTEEDGTASLAVPESEPATLFVISPEGTFGVARLDRADGSRLTLKLPRASSSLRIRARTTSGNPMPRFSLLMRYNGELVPLEVADELTVVQGLQFEVAESGEAHLRNIPIGTYEFWPYRTKGEVESIIAAGRDAAPPIQVDVREGENSIAVTFAAR